MPANPTLLDYLSKRRSVGLGFLAEPGPDAAQLEQLLTIGVRVPDHGKLAPWRLVLFSGDARAEAGEGLAAIAKAKNPALDEAGLEAERRRFLPAPLTIGVISTAKPHGKIPEFEQLISAGNVAFNLVNAAHALGFAAQWVTRWHSYDPEATAFLGAKEGEQFVAFVHIGTPTIVPEDRPRPNLAEIVTTWQKP